MTIDFKQNIALQLNYRTFRDKRFRMTSVFAKLAMRMLLKPRSIYRLPVDRYVYIDIPGSTLLNVVIVLKYAIWHLVHGFTMTYVDRIISPSQWHIAHRKAKTQYDNLIQLNNGN